MDQKLGSIEMRRARACADGVSSSSEEKRADGDMECRRRGLAKQVLGVDETGGNGQIRGNTWLRPFLRGGRSPPLTSAVGAVRDLPLLLSNHLLSTVYVRYKPKVGSAKSLKQP